MAEIHTFPQSVADKLRVRLSKIHTKRLHERWTDDLRASESLMTRAEYVSLVASSVGKFMELRLAEQIAASGGEAA